MQLEYKRLYPEEPETRVIKSTEIAISTKFNELVLES